jgi:hypothetical protein
MYMVRTSAGTFIYKDSSRDYYEKTNELDSEGLIYNTLKEAVIAGETAGYGYEVFKVKLNTVSPNKIREAFDSVTALVDNLTPAEKTYLRGYLEDTGY